MKGGHEGWPCLSQPSMDEWIDKQIDSLLDRQRVMYTDTWMNRSIEKIENSWIESRMVGHRQREGGRERLARGLK